MSDIWCYEPPPTWCYEPPPPCPPPVEHGHGRGHDVVHGNNGVGNGLDPQPPGNPPINDGPGTGPGAPGNQGGMAKGGAFRFA